MGREGSGVELRESSIRIKFVLNGETVRERLTVNGVAMKPTPANVKFANRIAEQVRSKIKHGTFEWAEFFPDSPRLAKQAAQADQEATTIKQLSELWLASKGRLSGATKDQYATAARFWCRLLGDDAKVANLTHKVLAAKIGGYPWPSAKTHNNYLIALRGMLALEYRGAESANNPLVGIENMRVVKKLPDPMTAEERDQILADMRTHYPPQVYAYFLWQFFTGMRPEETIALRWSDIDLKRQVIRVQRVRTFKGSERDGSKTGRERDVDLMPQALEAIAIMRPLTSMLAVEREGEDDRAADIFQNPVTRKPWHDERSQRDHYWRPTLKRLGIRWRTAYNTRHTFATVGLMAGVPAAYLADQCGHSTKMLLEVYARWIPGGDGGGARALLAAAMAASQAPRKTGAG